MQGNLSSQALVCQLSSASFGGIRSKGHLDQIGQGLTNGSYVVCCAPMPIGMRLEATAAAGHRTPGPRAILGRVVERLLAPLIATGFEPGPGAVRHGGEHDPEQAGDRSIHAGNIRFEGRCSLVLKANREWGVAGKTIEDVDL